MDGKPEDLQGPINQRGSDHKTGIESAPDDPTKRVPALTIEPIPELVKPLLGKENGGPVIEVGIELVDHGLVAEDAEQASDEGEDVDEA